MGDNFYWVTADVCVIECDKEGGYTGTPANWECAGPVPPATIGRGRPLDFQPGQAANSAAPNWDYSFPICVPLKCNQGFPNPPIKGLDVSGCGNVRTKEFCLLRCYPGYSDDQTTAGVPCCKGKAG